MDKEHMPAADAAHYELAFHVLPTVAEGEVADVFASLKSVIEKAGGTVTTQEEPKRFDLAYEIIKYLEGRNRKFTSAYFGWIRFTLVPAQLVEITEELEGENRILRHLLIRLNKMEEANPFMFHESLNESQVAVEQDEEATDEADPKDTDDQNSDGKDATEEVK
jgi:ribosomal protein S6